MKPGRYDIKVYRGAAFSLGPITWRVGGTGGSLRDLAGATAQAVLHPNGDDTTDLLMTVAISGVSDSIMVSMTGVATAALLWEDGTWDLTVTDSGGVPYRLVEGGVQVRG